MNFALKAGFAAAAVAVAASANSPSFAADLHGGSIKDDYAPVAMARPAAGPCYFRGDLGYSMSADPDVSWPVYNRTVDYSADPHNPTVTDTFVTDKVSNVSIKNTWLMEAGVGCGSGSRGFRADVTLGYRGKRSIEGEPGAYTVTIIDPVNPPPPPGTYDDPLHTSISSYALMFNVYKDLGNWGGFTPYVGAGIGLAYHMMDEVYFTGNPLLQARIYGDRDLAFAWSLMAGVGYQISDRTVLDFGYRYIDLGKATSERHDSAGFVNPRVVVDDLVAHEFKVGLRYHFGQSDCCAHVPMK